MWFRRSPELCEDGVGGLCPDGGLRVCVLSSDVGTDGLLEVGEGLERRFFTDDYFAVSRDAPPTSMRKLDLVTLSQNRALNPHGCDDFALIERYRDHDGKLVAGFGQVKLGPNRESQGRPGGGG